MSNSFHATSLKRLPSSPITANPPCTKKILLSSIKKTPSKIPKANSCIKRATSTPAICQPNRVTPQTCITLKTSKPDTNKKYPCFNCKCCQSIRQMQPFLLEIYERQKHISKLLSKANIGKSKSTPKFQRTGYVKNSVEVKRRHCWLAMNVICVRHSLWLLSVITQSMANDKKFILSCMVSMKYLIMFNYVKLKWIFCLFVINVFQLSIDEFQFNLMIFQ